MSDASRSALFGPSAAARNAGKANPYANVDGKAGAAPPAAPPAAAPSSSAASSSSSAASSAASPDEDAARAALLAGGRRQPQGAAVAAAPPSSPPGTGGGGGGSGSGGVQEAQHLFGGAMNEGDFEFDFADLNITSGAVGDAARAAGGGASSSSAAAAAAALAADGSLDFAAIDGDMARFEKDELVRDALNRGVDLRVYSKQVDGELRQMETLSIADYIKESDGIAALFEQIQGCESVLNQMQGLLQGFQDNLGGISDEIRSLQEESLALSVKMQNRKNVGAKVKTFLAKVAVPEALISRILEGEITEAWLRDLRTLSEKIEFLNGSFRSKNTATAAAAAQGAAPGDDAATGAFTDSLQDLSVNPLDTPAATQSVPIIRSLQAKAVARVRDFLARAIGEVVKPKTNMQKQQEYVLLKFAYAMAFLAEHGQSGGSGGGGGGAGGGGGGATDSGREIRQLYVREVGGWYADIFKRYADDLGKALLPWASKGDVIGNFDPAQLGAFAASASSASVSAGPSSGGGGGGSSGAAAGPALRPADPFCIADRQPLLADLATCAVLQPHVLQAERQRLPLETLFRSLLRHLSDVALAEEAFGRRFFGERESRDVLQQTLARALAAGLGFLDEHLPNCWDAPGLLLIVALVSAQWVASAQRGSGCLDGFFVRCIEAARKRFRAVFDANVASIKQAAANPRKQLGAFDSSPHTVTRRFAEWSASVLVLHRCIAHPAAADQMLLAHVSSVLREVEQLWARMGAELSGGKAAGAPSLPRAAFLLNQHAATLAVYGERGVTAEDAQAVAEAHGRALAAYVDESVDGQHFKVFAGWVRRAEAAAQQAAKQRGGPVFVPSVLASGVPAFLPEGLPAMGALEAAEAEAIVKDFALNWRNGLSALNDDVARFFGGGGGSGGKAAMAVLVAVFSRVAELHQRFSALAARAFPAGTPFVRDLVGLQTVYAEARRYGQR